MPRNLLVRINSNAVQIGHLAVYALWVIGSFAFVALVPHANAATFLSTYASGSLVASLFAIPIYTSWQRRWFDALFVCICLGSVVLAADGQMLLLYWMAAFALNIVDFSVAQTCRPRAVVIMRIIVSASALFLLFEFHLALVARLVICAAAIAWSIAHKAYEAEAPLKFDIKKFIFTALTCGLYYVPLASIPQITGRDAKVVYIAYAFSGSAILKLQDFMIKMRVADLVHSKDSDMKLYFFISIFAVILLFAILLLINPWYVLFCVPMIFLIATIGFVKNVAWN